MEEPSPAEAAAVEMERVRKEVLAGRITSLDVSRETLTRVLEGMGSIEREALEVDVSLSQGGIALYRFTAAGAVRVHASTLGALFTSMPPGAVRVRRLSLRNAHMGDTGAEALARELEANTTVTELRLDHNDITEAGARHLAGALRANATLLRLDMYDNPLGTGGISALAEALGANGTLVRLLIGPTTCEGGGMRALADAVAAHPSLTDLRLQSIPLDEEGTLALVEMLRATRSLRRLDLERGTLSRAGTELSFVSGLRHATSLVHLNLMGHRLGDNCAVELASALLVESCALAFVEVSFCSIGAAGAAALAGALVANRSLVRLDLSGNRELGVEGTKALFESLAHNSTLAVLSLRGCGTHDSDGTLALAAALARPGCALEALDLEGCAPAEESVHVLADALATNTSITTFVCSTLTPIDPFRAATERNRRLREASVAQRDYLRSAAGLAAVPWIAEDVLVSILSEYAGRAWWELEVALHERTGSHFFPYEEPFADALDDKSLL